MLVALGLWRVFWEFDEHRQRQCAERVCLLRAVRARTKFHSFFISRLFSENLHLSRLRLHVQLQAIGPGKYNLHLEKILENHPCFLVCCTKCRRGCPFTLL